MLKLTLELNVFKMCIQPPNVRNDIEEGNIIEDVVEENFNQGNYSDPLEVCLVNSFESNVQLDPDVSNMCTILYSTQEIENKGWKPKFEELDPLKGNKSEEAPKV